MRFLSNLLCFYKLGKVMEKVYRFMPYVLVELISYPILLSKYRECQLLKVFLIIKKTSICTSVLVAFFMKH